MNIVIDGAGEVGSHLAKMLSREGAEVAVIDNDSDRLNGLTAYADVEPIEGEPSSLSTLEEAEVGKADLFIAAFPYVNQEVNLVAALFAKRLGAKKVVARITDLELLALDADEMLRQMGIDLTFCPEKIAADEIVSILRRGVDSDTMDFARGMLQVEAFRLGEDSPILDMKLVDFTTQFSTEASSQFRVIAISRDKKTIIPKFDTKFRYGDLVYIIIRKDGLKTLTDYLGMDDVAVDKVMIMGGGLVGAITAAKLSREVSDVKLVDIDRDRCIELVENLPEEVLVVNGDARNADFLIEEGISNYDAFVALTGNDEANILACVAAKKFGVHKTVAEVENIEYVQLAEEMGVDSVINKKLVTASNIFKLTLSERAKFVRYMNGTDAEVLEYTAAPGSDITKAQLKDINFPKDAVVGGIVRGDEAFIAVGATQVQPGDRVVVFTMPRTSRQIDKLFK